MMGLLTGTIIDQLASGKYTVDQTYLILIPEDAARTSYESKTLHSLLTGDDTVTDHGVMVREGYNRSISTPGNLRFGEYKFQLANLNGEFNPDSDIWVHGTTSYLAEAHECKITRWTSIKTSGGSFTLIPGTLYRGKVDRVEYINKNFGKPKSATVFCTPLSLEKITGRTWNEDDSDEFALTGLQISAPLPELN